jgi:membrane-associated phospholipid phosphatase
MVLKFRKDWVGGLMFVVAILIAASVLTTKQHYVLDVFGGLAMALISLVFAI